MGTNYYLNKPACQCCGRSDDPLHIGKSSAGWCFSLHVDDWLDIHSLNDWVERWNEPDAIIKDEYGRIVSPDDMLKIITERGRDNRGGLTVNWLNQNHAIPGPNHLARRRIDDHHCVGHGEGTWDLIQGDFS